MNNWQIVSIANDDPRQEQITQELIDIDKECFGQLNYSDQGDLSYWLNTRPASYVEVLEIDQKIEGYIDFLTLSRRGTKKLLDGQWRDGEVEPADLCFKPENRLIDLYLVSVAIRKKFRGNQFGKKLWESARQRFMVNNIKIQNIYSVIWSKDGTNYLKPFSPKLIGTDQAGHEIVKLLGAAGELPKFVIK